MKIARSINVPHPFPYQGSKRGIAKFILPHVPSDVRCFYEPFCGTGAVSIAVAAHGLAKRFVLSDLNEPLIALWTEILEKPQGLCDEYERLWLEQQPDRKAYFFKVRDEFNKSHDPRLLLYLLARIVKGSVRYSADGKFNQSADNRRSGSKPDTMRRNIFGVSRLLGKKTKAIASDFREAVQDATEDDLIYMDPPYQGTSSTRDQRYLKGLPYDEFVEALTMLNDRKLSYIVSYDGTTGEKTHGKLLPRSLELEHRHVHAGRSCQATLLGNSHETIEYLYLSPALVGRLNKAAMGETASEFVLTRLRQYLQPAYRCQPHGLRHFIKIAVDSGVGKTSLRELLIYKYIFQNSHSVRVGLVKKISFCC